MSGRKETEKDRERKNVRLRDTRENVYPYVRVCATFTSQTMDRAYKRKRGKKKGRSRENKKERERH